MQFLADAITPVGKSALLVNTQVHGIAAAHAPVLHLRRVEPGGMFTTYVDCFERVWADAVPLSNPAHV